MAKPTAYQLLKDIHEVTGNLETKFNERFTAVEKRVDVVEGVTNNMVGKIGIGVIVLSTIIGAVVNFVVDLFRKR
ncbi:hypothetical protein LCGC14_1023940 [marine sediment metagenome]|uniref:Uncharacterized protein n=1 Tax=marine sediment metagenome TaxID=412755 RepID=A0A0F9NI76_9ZZZZ